GGSSVACPGPASGPRNAVVLVQCALSWCVGVGGTFAVVAAAVVAACSVVERRGRWRLDLCGGGRCRWRLDLCGGGRCRFFSRDLRAAEVFEAQLARNVVRAEVLGALRQVLVN